MKNSQQENRITRIAAVVVFAAVLIVLLCMSVVALFRTVDVGFDAQLNEIINIRHDNGYLNFIVIVIAICVLFLIYRYLCSMLSRKTLLMLLMSWVLVFGIAFVNSASRMPAGDAEIVANAAFMASRGDLSGISSYFVQYPYRLGLAACYELMFRVLAFFIPNITRGYSFMALQVFNVICVAVSYAALTLMAGLLFESERVEKLTAIMLVFFTPPIISCTGLNGRVFAFALAVLALLLFVLCLEREEMRYGILSALCMGLSVCLKLDSLIIYIAVMIVCVLEFIEQRKHKYTAYMLLCTICVLLLMQAPPLLYRLRTGIDFNSYDESLSSAVGLDEVDTGSLWYDGRYSVLSDGAQSTQIYASNNVTNSHTESAVTSFSDRLLIQWNDPTFYSIRGNQNCRHYSPPGPLAELVCGSGQRVIKALMNIFQIIVLSSSSFALAWLMREGKNRQCLPVLIIMGGFLFHLIYQAKSQYAMNYFMMMIPLAAYGLGGSFHGQQKLQNKEAATDER